MSIFDGELAKLSITVCEDTEPFGLKAGEDFTYHALLNPEEIQSKFKTVFDETQPPGTTGADVRFKVQLPQKFDVELLFDGTGVLSESALPGITITIGSGPVESVDKQIERFKKIVFTYDGAKHAPNLLHIQWGSFIFKGKMLEMTIKYTLFKPDGTPLRAKAACKFVESVSDALRVAQERSESPDLTHIRFLKKDETLPGMAHSIYGDPSYYMKVARANNLDSFRALKPGAKIVFPPSQKRK